MLQDKIFVGVLIGAMANAVRIVFNYLAYLFGFTKVVFWQIAASHFLDKNDLFSPAAYLIGAVADFTVAAILGVTFIYALDFIGKENMWLRGIGLGLTAWVILFGTVLGKTVQAKLPQEPSGILVTMTAHFIYGLCFAVFAGLYFKMQVKLQDKTGQGKISSFNFVPAPARKIKTFHIKKEKSEEKPQKIKLIKPKKI